MDTQDLLAERGKTHGDYTEHADYTQAIKRIVEASPRWQAMHDHERETLHMIAHKIGRIMAGDPHFVDHWDDIAGYAKLSADRNRT